MVHPWGCTPHCLRRLWTICQARVSSWDQTLVLGASTETQFQPLESVPGKMLTFKVGLLQALMSLKKVGDIQALSVASSSLDFATGDVRAILHPRMDYIPKFLLVGQLSCRLSSLCLMRHKSKKSLHLLYLACGLRIYVHRSGQWHRSYKLVVCFSGRNRGNVVPKQRILH